VFHFHKKGKRHIKAVNAVGTGKVKAPEEGETKVKAEFTQG
jgi:hypothetical protein